VEPLLEASSTARLPRLGYRVYIMCQCEAYFHRPVLKCDNTWHMWVNEVGIAFAGSIKYSKGHLVIVRVY